MIETAIKKSRVGEIKIGSKPTTQYVHSIFTELKKGKTKKITLLARGKTTSKAIDILEILKGLKKVKSSIVKTGTTIFEHKNEKTSVSTILIEIEIEN